VQLDFTTYLLTTNRDSYGHFTLKNTSFSADFSTVKIKVGGTEKTYQEWIEAGSSPVTLSYRKWGGGDSFVELNASNSYSTASWTHATDFVETVNFNMEIQVETTAAFTGESYVDFQPATYTIKTFFNGRGDEVTLPRTTGANADLNVSPYLAYYTLAAKFTPTPSAVHVAILSPTEKGMKTHSVSSPYYGTTLYRSDIPYIISPPADMSDLTEMEKALFENQELFKVFAVPTSDSLKNSGQTLELFIDIPEGITVTHMRLPSSNGGYDTVTVKSGTDTVVGSGAAGLIGLTAPVVGGPGSGELKLEITGLTLDGIRGSTLSLATHSEGITFAGTVNGATIAADSELKFEGTGAVSAGTASPIVPPYNFTTTVTDPARLSVDMYMLQYADSGSNTVHLFYENADRTAPITGGFNRSDDGLSDNFYMYAAPNAASVSFSSALRTDVTNRVNSAVYPDPVVYFVLPDGLDTNVASGDLLTATSGATRPRTDGNAETNPAAVVTGLYRDGQNRKVVEVLLYDGVAVPAANGKLALSESTDQFSSAHIWLTGAAGGAVGVFLPVHVRDTFNGSQITVNTPDARDYVHAGTWRAEAAKASITTAGYIVTDSTGFALSGLTATDAPLAAPVAEAGGFTSHRIRYTRTYALEKITKLDIYTAVKVGGGYSYYDPVSPAETYAELYAGDDNEFKLVINNAGGQALTNAPVYFFPPAHPEGGANDPAWRTIISGKPEWVAGESTPSLSGAYTMYYTTDDIPGGIGVIDDGSLVGSGASGIQWHGFDNLTGAVDKAGITGIKVVVTNAPDGTYFTLRIPFYVPAYPDIDAESYGDPVIGRTMWAKGNAASSTAKTAAVKLIKSAKPLVMESNGAGGDRQITDTVIDGVTPANRGAKNGEIPDWWRIISYDDRTGGVGISEVKVEFTPAGGSLTQIKTFGAAESDNASAYSKPGYASGKTTILDAGGANLDAAGALTFVNLNSYGVYTITYTSGSDADGQRTTEVRRITVTEQEKVRVSYVGAEPAGAGIAANIPASEESYKGAVDYVIKPEGVNPTLPSLEGYIFDGWKLQGGGDTVYKAGATYSAGVNADLVFAAQWTLREKVTVRYVGNEPAGAGTAVNIPASEQIYKGAADYRIKPVADADPILPALGGYTFDGWKLQGGDDTVYKAGAAYSAVVNTDLVFTAQWKKETAGSISAVVRYEANKPAEATGVVNGLPPQENTTVGADYTVKPVSGAPTLDGYTFLHYTNGGSVTYQPGDTCTIAAPEIVFTAQWKKNDTNDTNNGNNGNNGGDGTTPPGSGTGTESEPETESDSDAAGETDTAGESDDSASEFPPATTYVPGGLDPGNPPAPTVPGHNVIPSGDVYIEIDDDGTPLGEWHWDEPTEMWIFDAYPPLGNLPQTGEQAGRGISIFTWGILALFGAAAGVFAFRPRRKYKAKHIMK
jgi:hypothetical protein